MAAYDVTLPGKPESVREAREFVAGLLHGHPGLDDILLMVSEVASNAVLHTRSGGGTFTVVVHVGGDTRVEVHDQGSDGVPQIRVSGRDGTGGRGMFLVERLSSGWGFQSGDAGNVVWFEYSSLVAAPA